MYPALRRRGLPGVPHRDDHGALRRILTREPLAGRARRPSRAPSELHGEVGGLLEPFFDARENPKGKKIRLIGVRVEKLVREGGQGAT